ncbi:MAG: electron transfer flavoprotein beta subunit/FixA family protein [Kiritimatiellae bacterium]|nr:electron transfer flavoprotein beta subunit/FixA family protein [Kiritimatiellia bacterium]
MGLNVVVLAREVWDTRDLTGAILDESGGIRPGALQTRYEPEDLNALEAALRLKDAQGATVTVLSPGEVRQVDVAREALYRGADAAVRVAADPDELDDAALAGVLAAAVRKLGTVNLLLVGTSVPDTAGSILARHLAHALGWPAVSWVDAIEQITADRVVARRAVEMGYESVEAPLPAVLAVGVALLEDDPRAPRPAKAMLKLKLKKAEIPCWTAAELGSGDPAAARTTRRLRREPVPPRTIETRTVDPENEAELRAMLDAVRKGA